ncbi:protein phosphatase CheZ [Undibacterium oligocarboniphilum]|uniref:Protein phosphatase CheZ n=1 Tax=Undibacterium oligocarboniphilum TaxID=666702 RepID=A0A850QD38_9BURK|nr:protein phosphatase CheZ [Undibacterium oligocarboniphilum]MBC3868796.1 protein phosphatase CheZ [Undibacterium oligocarboniphilum]NVO76777.1 protein phosphatase CheZ [Undibacterium oligocarboniphilum]
MTDSEDDLEALFDEMANQRQEGNAPPPAVTEPAVVPSNNVLTTEQPAKLNFHNTDVDSTKPIFDRLGNVVRMLHDSMRQLGYDRSLSDVAIQVADAQDRLEYVATLTEQAANKVLNATDLGMPEQDELAKKARNMDERWDNLFAGKLSIEEFKVLAADSKTFAHTVLAATDAEKARLLDIMMAQDFQDLTGQLIKKVVAINKAVERELAQILLDNAPSDLKEKAVELMEGPSVPNAALEQDDVDNLLDSLGF